MIKNKIKINWMIYLKVLKMLISTWKVLNKKEKKLQVKRIMFFLYIVLILQLKIE